MIGVGDNVVDKYLDLGKMFPGGNALNVSVLVRQLGKETGYLGVLGNDREARHIEHVLESMEIDISHCKHVTGPTGFAEVTLIDGDRIFVGSNGGGVGKTHRILLNQTDLQYLQNYTIIHSSCYSFLEDQIPLLSELPTILSFDFSQQRDDEYLQNICPFIDIGFISCGDLSVDATKQLLKKMHALGTKTVVATRGVQSVLFYDGNHFIEALPEPTEVLDTLGAGDAFISQFLVCYSEILSNNTKVEVEKVQQALAKANQFAQSVCMTYGAFGHGLEIS